MRNYTSMIDLALVRVVAPKCDPKFVEPIRKACVEHDMLTVRRIAAFIAQCAHESLGFTALNEVMSYSTAERIKEIFGKGDAGRARFPTLASCVPYVKQPEKLANYVYANRMGNGPPASGDGWRFRGGSPLHVTGKRNWTLFAESIGMPVEEAMAYARTPEGGMMAAAWFWESNDINRLADTPGVADESKAINGGTIGLEQRKTLFDKLVGAMLAREKAGG